MSAIRAPPPDGDRNRAAELITVTWTWCIFSIVFVTLRFYSRIRITNNVWWDELVHIINDGMCSSSSVDWSTDDLRISYSLSRSPRYGLCLPRTMAVDIFTT